MALGAHSTLVLESVTRVAETLKLAIEVNEMGRPWPQANAPYRDALMSKIFEVSSLLANLKTSVDEVTAFGLPRPQQGAEQ